MKKKYTNYIIKELGLVIQYLEGIITIDVLKDLKSELWEDASYSSEYPVLIDIRRSEIHLTETELRDYGNWLICHQTTHRKPVNSALLTNTPRQVALSTLFIKKNDKSKLRHEIFSTLDGAAHYLDIDRHELKAIYEKLKIAF
jgi:hypothetical protein